MDFGQKVSIFRDEQHTRQFQQEGYVVLPLLEATDVAALRAHYEQFHPQGVKGFYSTTFAPEEAHRQAVDQTIRQVCTPAIDRYFHDYKALFSSFIAKAPGADSALAMHQDMTLLDETVYTGTNIWCPLIDLNEQNGAIAVLPRSHRLFFTYRGATLPDIYDGEVERLLPLMKPFHLKAGEAIVFDQSIIHCSPPNLSEAERPVVNTFIAHRDAQIRICYRDKENRPETVEIFEQDDDFLFQFAHFGHDIFARPNIGRSLGHFPYDFPKLTAERIAAEFGPVANGRKPWWKFWA